MALAPIGVLDLSVVTNTLISRLNTYVSTTSPLLQTFDTNNDEPLPTPPPPSITCSGAMPDAVRKEAGCQLTFSLFHVTEDKFQRNSPMLNPWAQGNPGIPSPRPQTLQPVPYQPLCLNLYYLLTAFADQQYQQEQQAMSMAMQFFYQTPIVRMQVVLPGIAGSVAEEFTLTMEIETSDELARLWQAITVPMRLSVIYKVSVVLLTPPAAPPAVPPVQTIRLLSEPATFPYASGGQVIGTSRTVTFASLKSTSAVPAFLSVDYSPAVAAPGQQFALQGSNLNLATSNNVYLLMPDGTEFNVSSWMVPEPPALPIPPSPPSFQTPSCMTLQLPATVGALPGNAPAAGVYQLRAGCDLPTPYRTNATPFSVGAWIDTSSVPSPNPPVLPAVGGTYTIAGQGFVAGTTEMLLDTIPLPAANFDVVSGAEVTFTIPASVPPGTYTVRVRVSGVESPPAWWVVKP
jgi:Pvc16 N-terminal domain